VAEIPVNMKNEQTRIKDLFQKKLRSFSHFPSKSDEPSSSGIAFECAIV
jgi:hypothetical protein